MRRRGVEADGGVSGEFRAVAAEEVGETHTRGFDAALGERYGGQSGQQLVQFDIHDPRAIFHITTMLNGRALHYALHAPHRTFCTARVGPGPAASLMAPCSSRYLR